MKERIYSKTIADAINTFLDEDDWNFSFDEKTGLFKFSLSIRSKLKKINYIIDVKEDEYIVYAISPIGADDEDKEMMARMAEFVCRANYGLKNGNFELDMRDGEVRFKCFVDCEGALPSKDIIHNSIYCPAAMFRRYGDGIVNIIFSNTTAKEAVDQCEGKTASDAVRSLLHEIADDAGEESSEISELLARLTKRLGADDEDASSESDDETDDETDDDYDAMITDLFDSEGEDDE